MINLDFQNQSTMIATKKERIRLEDEALIKDALERFSGMKAKDFFPRKNKLAREKLIRTGLIKVKP